MAKFYPKAADAWQGAVQRRPEKDKILNLTQQIINHLHHNLPVYLFHLLLCLSDSNLWH